MQTVWFIVIAFMLSMYTLLDGFDLGAGVIHLSVGKTNQERKTILRTIGPVWDGNEVWLIASGGVLFFTFPLLYASSFSGFYLPLFIVLWLLMLRGVSIELRSHIDNPVWATFWDGAFFLGSALLAVFYGAALANVIRGVPLSQDGYFFEPLWTDFNPYSRVTGILDWYTILIGLLALAALTTHGANWVALKTEGIVNERARRVSSRAWLATVALTVLGTAATFAIRPAMLGHFGERPWGVIFPVIALGGLAGMGYYSRKGSDWAASGAYVVGMLASAAFGLYPALLPSSIPGHTLTVQNASGSHYGQSVGLVWWGIGMVLAAIYVTLTYRLFRGKVRVASGEGY